MVKKLLSTVMLCLFVVSATAVAQVNIGYMNTQQAMRELPAMEQVQQELNTFIQEKQQELTKRATAYQEEVANYQSNQGSMSAQQQQQREQELQENRTALDEFNQQIRMQIQQQREDLLAPVLARMDNAIAEEAEAQGLDFVLNQTTNNGESVLFYASSNQVNITQQVINRLKSSSE